MKHTTDPTAPVRTAVYESPDASRVIEVYRTAAYGKTTLLTYCPLIATKHEAWGNWHSQFEPMADFMKQNAAVRDVVPADMIPLHATLFLNGWRIVERNLLSANS